MTLAILNDWHIGAIRSAGTTPTTAHQLRLDLLQQFEETLYDINSDLMILGDLFDGPDISKQDLFRTYQVLDDWLGRTGKSLWLVNGNHDLSKRSDTFSSFQLLAALLSAEGAYAGTVTHVVEGHYIKGYDTYVIPHVANTDLFNLELSKVPACTYLCVHANYDNGFAVESDHSLNMSEAQAKAVRAEHIIFAHEHQQKTALQGKVVITGNQQCSSVSDCLNNSSKQYASITDEGLEFTTTWSARGDFSEQNWRALTDTGRFIRVVGEATAAEAGAVISAISRFRASAQALVITNAVKIEGVNDAAQLELSHEEISAFSVLEALRPMLDEGENKKITTLLEKQNA